MTKAEILKQIEELKKQVEELSDDEKKIRTMPNDGEKYFFINESLICDFGANYPELFDMGTIKKNSSVGNYFKSDEDAEMVIRAIQIEQAIRIRRIELNDGWEPDWDDTDDNYYFYFSIGSSCLAVHRTFLVNFLPVFGYYKSEEIVEQIVDEFNDDLLWYFNEYYPNKDKMYVWGE